MRTEERAPDPQWDFTLLIRGELDARGHYSTEVDPRDAQAVVDLRWAALQAGRLLGVPVKVDVSGGPDLPDSVATATVRLLDVAPREPDVSTPGLERLLRWVLHAESSTTGVPEPRSPQDA
jgi:hypothetical protein